MSEDTKSIRFNISHKGIDPGSRHKVEEAVVAAIPGLVCSGGGSMLVGECGSDSSYKFDLPVEKIQEIYKKFGLESKIRFF